jgi:1-acyl-sn-glycerol-3-phosphate acyltransferase
MTEQESAISRALGIGFTQLVRWGLHGIWLRGELPSSQFIWAANHHSWWDGFVAAAVLAQEHRPAALLMDGDNLDQFRFLRSAGVISAARPRAALDALRLGRVLVVFPEAELRNPGALGPIRPGAAWLAQHAPAALVPVAVRICTRGHQYPEAFLDVGAPVPDSDIATALADQVNMLDRLIAAAGPREPPAGFLPTIAGRSSWDERIDRISKTFRR